SGSDDSKRAGPSGAAGVASARAACALLPDARLRPGCRGRRAGDDAQRLARARAIRRPQRAAIMAVLDCDECVPADDRAATEACAPDRLRPCLRSARAAWATAARVDSDRTLSGHRARPG